jgi:hypothetical protein
MPDVGAIEAISAMERPTRRNPAHTARKVQMSPPGPPFPKPNATVARIASQVPMMIRANPNIETKPKLRCTNV